MTKEHYDDIVIGSGQAGGPLSTALARSTAMTVAERLDARYEKFRRMGEEGTAFIDMAKTVEP